MFYFIYIYYLASFNSRAPRGARPDEETAPAQASVSIHVPLAEHDVCSAVQAFNTGCFNSRAPRGARRVYCRFNRYGSEFQFTCPSRSTTQGRTRMPSRSAFQFTCPSRSTTSGTSGLVSRSVFQFTCPSRSTTGTFDGNVDDDSFQFTCPSRSTTC